ncbi:MAG TPA: hypothetical protein VF556_11190 [Pyrinomonadaceae bacterium]|jgi:hypothetical protein
MFLSLILVLLVAFGGMALTYLFADEKSFLWRLAAGNIIGSAVFGTIGFVVACFFGLSTATVAVTLLLALAPLALFGVKEYREEFFTDWRAASGKMQNTNFSLILRFAFYAFFFLLFWFFFERTMFETREGIFTGGSQNLGDLPFHLGAIYSFTDGANFPPENPSFAGAKFSYPFIADFLTACFVKLGAGIKEAMRVQNVFWAFSLLVILERFVVKTTNSRTAGKIAPALLFFSGGLGFLWFFSDFLNQSQSLSNFLFKLPRDYTIGENFRWGNSLVTLFITQRSLLIGMPLTLIILQKLWEIFSETERRRAGDAGSEIRTSHFSPFSLSPFLVGLFAGTLPLVHLHSLAVLFVVAAFLFFFRLDKLREWLMFGVGVAVIAVPELLWSTAESATRTSEFFGWHFGWDKGEANFFWFWLKNTGLFIPITLAGIYLIYSKQTITENSNAQKKLKVKDEDKQNESENQSPKTKAILLFYLPFVFLFLVSNSAKLAPWAWDNIKVLIYFWVGSIPFVAFALAWAWRKNVILKIVAAVCFAALISAGALDVWRVVTKQINYNVFSADAVKIAEQIKLKTEPNALFLNAPTYNTAVVLSGRRSLMRYLGHLSSHGIDYAEREMDAKRIYAGDASADILLKKHNIEYVLISPEERSAQPPNESYFAKYPIIAESGQYKVYKIK